MDVAAIEAAAVVGRVGGPGPAVEIARIGAAGAEAVIAAAGERMLLDHRDGAGRKLPIRAGREGFHLRRELRHQAVESRRRNDRGGGEQHGAERQRGQRDRAKLAQEQRRHHHAKDGQQQRHALADQDDHRQRGRGQRAGGEAAAQRRGLQQRRDRRQQRREQQARQRGGGAGFCKRSGEFAVAPAVVAEQVGAEAELDQRLQRDVRRAGGDDVGHPAAGRGIPEYVVLERGDQDQVTDDGERLGQRVRAALADARQRAEHQPGPPYQAEREPALADPSPVAEDRAADEEDHADEGDR